MAAHTQALLSVLTKATSHTDLQAARAKVEAGLEQERAAAEGYLRGQQQHAAPPSMHEVEERLEVRWFVCVRACVGMWVGESERGRAE